MTNEPGQSIRDRDALIGVIIAGGFGIAWAFWAASGLTGASAMVVRIAGAVVGVVLVADAIFSRGGSNPEPNSDAGSMFGSRGYAGWVAAELVALVAGNLALSATGHGGYVAAWTALVVGVHFIGFGWLFAPMFYWLGMVFIAAAVVGVTAGACTGTREAVVVSTGLIAATGLFATGAWGLLL